VGFIVGKSAFCRLLLVGAKAAFILLLFFPNIYAQKPEPENWATLSAHFAQVLASGTSEQKRDALFEIRNLENASASRLALVALRDRDEIVRTTAAASVVFLPETEAAGHLLLLLDDRAPFVRKEAAYALGLVASRSATQRLIRALQRDRDIEVKAAAAIALGLIGDTSALQPLAAVLRQRPREDDQMLRRAAARAIGQTAELVRFGRTDSVIPQNFLPEQYKDIPQKSEYPSEPTHVNIFAPYVPLLISVLQDAREEADTRREAAFALGAIGSNAAFPVLQQHAQSPDPYLAEISREALLKIRPPSSPLH
jgi:HEAT repeat protein